MFVLLSLYLIPKSVQTRGHSFHSLKLKSYHHRIERLKCSSCIDTNVFFLDIPSKSVPVATESLGSQQPLPFHNQTFEVNDVKTLHSPDNIRELPFSLFVIIMACTVLVLWCLRYLKKNSKIDTKHWCPKESLDEVLPTKEISFATDPVSPKSNHFIIADTIEALQVVSTSDGSEASRTEVAEDGEFVWPGLCYKDSSTNSFPSTVSDVSTEVDHGVTYTWEVSSEDCHSESLGSLASLGSSAAPTVLSSCTSLVPYHPHPRLSRDYFAAIHSPAIMAPNLMAHMPPPLGTEPIFHIHHPHHL